jgi:hypothetical protein
LYQYETAATFAQKAKVQRLCPGQAHKNKTGGACPWKWHEAGFVPYSKGTPPGKGMRDIEHVLPIRIARRRPGKCRYYNYGLRFFSECASYNLRALYL